MGTEIEAGILHTFVENWGQIGVDSTGAAIVAFVGTLYNVDGSRGDPKINKQGWTALLIANSISGNCHVTGTTGAGAAPAGSTHPGFDVGEHMTTNSTCVPPATAARSLTQAIAAGHDRFVGRGGAVFLDLSITLFGSEADQKVPLIVIDALRLDVTDVPQARWQPDG